MKCLVTGCAGFIGSHLSRALVAEGNTVRGIDCFTDYYPRRIKLSNLSGLKNSKGFQFVEADLSSSRLPPLIKGVDTIFHLAAQPGVRASWGTSFSHYVKDNIVATQRLLEAARASESIKKVVFASSSSIYGDAEQLPTRESAVPRPVSPYGATKLAGESLCHVYLRNYSVPVVTLRYFTVYGPRQRPDMAFNIFISRMSRGEEVAVYGDGEQGRDFTFVGDTVAGTILAARANPGSVYNVGTGKTTSLNSIISTIESILGKKAKIRKRPSFVGDVTDTAADIGRIRKELGFEPRTSLIEGLKQQIAFQVR